VRFRQQRIVTNLDAEKNFLQTQELLTTVEERLDSVEARLSDLEAVPAWIEVGSGGSAPAFANSWVNADAAQQTVAFTKDQWGWVEIKGQVDTGTNGTTIFTLPSGYRPPLDATFPSVGLTGLTPTAGFIVVDSTGTVTPTTMGNTLVSLNGIRFRV